VQGKGEKRGKKSAQEKVAPWGDRATKNEMVLWVQQKITRLVVLGRTGAGRGSALVQALLTFPDGTGPGEKKWVLPPITGYSSLARKKATNPTAPRQHVAWG